MTKYSHTEALPLSKLWSTSEIQCPQPSFMASLESPPKYYIIGAVGSDQTIRCCFRSQKIKDKIFVEELPPWMRLFAGYKVGHLCRDFADQFHMYCNPGRLRIAPGVTGRQPPTGRQTRGRIGRLTAGTAGRKA